MPTAKETRAHRQPHSTSYRYQVFVDGDDARRHRSEIVRHILACAQFSPSGRRLHTYTTKFTNVQMLVVSRARAQQPEFHLLRLLAPFHHPLLPAPPPVDAAAYSDARFVRLCGSRRAAMRASLCEWFTRFNRVCRCVYACRAVCVNEIRQLPRMAHAAVAGVRTNVYDYNVCRKLRLSLAPIIHFAWHMRGLQRRVSSLFFYIFIADTRR